MREFEGDGHMVTLITLDWMIVFRCPFWPWLHSWLHLGCCACGWVTVGLG